MNNVFTELETLLSDLAHQGKFKKMFFLTSDVGGGGLGMGEEGRMEGGVEIGCNVAQITNKY